MIKDWIGIYGNLAISLGKEGNYISVFNNEFYSDNTGCDRDEMVDVLKKFNSTSLAELILEIVENAYGHGTSSKIQ